MVGELVQPGTSPAYADYGRWVARSGRPDRCSYNAELEPFQPAFACPECGAVTEVIWPDAETVQGVVRLLMMRPHAENRNWKPGESLIDLMVENAEHGIFDGAGLDAAPGTALLVVDDNRIQTDALPASVEPALAIGGAK